MSEQQTILTVPYVQQINETACGAAALEMVYRYYGVEGVSQKAIYDKYKEPDPHKAEQSRMSVDKLVADARDRGFRSFWARADYDNDKFAQDILGIATQRFHIPVIVCQQFTEEDKITGHFRVVLGFDAYNNVYFHDPSVEHGGPNMVWSVEKFRNFWEKSGENVVGGIYVIIEKKNDSNG